jgi:hypothetical protein
MLAMCRGMTEEEFVNRHSVASAGNRDDSNSSGLVSAARRLLWKKLCSFGVKAGWFLSTDYMKMICLAL